MKPTRHKNAVFVAIKDAIDARHEIYKALQSVDETFGDQSPLYARLNEAFDCLAVADGLNTIFKGKDHAEDLQLFLNWLEDDTDTI